MTPMDPLDKEIFEMVLEATCEELKLGFDIDDRHLELEVRRELTEIVISHGIDDVDTMRQLLMARVMDRGTR
jgi:hypothetical protein